MKVEIGNNGRTYRLLDDVAYPWDGIIVPSGYITDFATVPKILWFVFPPTGFYQKAALLHDFAYEHHRVLALTRWDADALFMRQMKRDGVGWKTRYPMWIAVRLFGAAYWDRH